MRKVDDQHCNQPDRDFAKIPCGYPLPCPYHTIVIDLPAGTVTSPANAPMIGTLKAMRVRDALSEEGRS